MKFLIFVVFLMSACVQTHEKHEGMFSDNVSSRQHLTANDNSEIFFQGTPLAENLPALKLKGITHVINMREISEQNEKRNKKNIESIGLKYTSIPFGDNIDKVTEALLKNKKGKTLIYCHGEGAAKEIADKLNIPVKPLK